MYIFINIFFNPNNTVKWFVPILTLTLMFIYLWFLFYYYERQEISSLFIFICSSCLLSYVQISTSFIWPPLTSGNIELNYFLLQCCSQVWPVTSLQSAIYQTCRGWDGIDTHLSKLQLLKINWKYWQHTTSNSFSSESNLNKNNKLFLYFFKFKPPEWN